MPQPQPLYIVASPRPGVGKTLIARLLIDFFRTGNRSVVGYDLDPREPDFAGCFPKFVSTVDITETRGQMALFDRLVAGDPRATVIDLGYSLFEKFFAVLTEIGFVREARRRRIEPILLFVADSTPTTARAYAELWRQSDALTIVPVHNESVTVMFERDHFPPTRPEYGVIRIPRLSPMVRGVLDRPSFSLGAYMSARPGGPTEIHSWIGKIFTEFRELELRILLGKLSLSLGGIASARPREAGRVR
jgi:hypothetical protein